MLPVALLILWEVAHAGQRRPERLARRAIADRRRVLRRALLDGTIPRRTGRDPARRADRACDRRRQRAGRSRSLLGPDSAGRAADAVLDRSAAAGTGGRAHSGCDPDARLRLCDGSVAGRVRHVLAGADLWPCGDHQHRAAAPRCQPRAAALGARPRDQDRAAGDACRAISWRSGWRPRCR